MLYPIVCLALLRIALAALAFTALACQRDARPRNVLLVTLDTTRPDFFGAYGFERETTPHFDALAAEGALFELALASSAATPMAHASILSGLDPPRHGLRVMAAGSGFALDPGVPTLASLLRGAGWHTAAVHSAFTVSSHFGLDAGFEHVDEVPGAFRADAQRAKWDVPRLQRRADETTDRALALLGELREPFLLWVHYWDPHDVYQLPPDEFLHSLPRGQEGWIKTSRKRYAAELQYVDAQFGRLWRRMGERGFADDTVVVVTSDHGEGLGEHGWTAHRLLYQEQLQVPLIVRVPGRREGVRIPALVRSVDILPTLLEAAGVEVPADLDGRSLLPLIEGEPDAPRVAYAEQLNGWDDNAGMVAKRPHDDFVHMATDGEWKLLYRPAHPDESELFHLVCDPEEAIDLWEVEPEQRRRLLRDLARVDGWRLEPFSASEHAAAELASAHAALASLGYVAGEPALVQPLHWAWSCTDHPQVSGERGGLCPICGEPLVPRAID